MIIIITIITINNYSGYRGVDRIGDKLTWWSGQCSSIQTLQHTVYNTASQLYQYMLQRKAKNSPCDDGCHDYDTVDSSSSDEGSPSHCASMATTVAVEFFPATPPLIIDVTTVEGVEHRELPAMPPELPGTSTMGVEHLHLEVTPPLSRKIESSSSSSYVEIVSHPDDDFQTPESGIVTHTESYSTPSEQFHTPASPDVYFTPSQPTTNLDPYMGEGHIVRRLSVDRSSPEPSLHRSGSWLSLVGQSTSVEMLSFSAVPTHTSHTPSGRTPQSAATSSINSVFRSVPWSSVSSLQ